jgi:hypothetical protein
MAVRVVSTIVTAAAAGPPVGSVVGASAVAAAAVRVATAAVRVATAAVRSAVRDDLTIAVATL